MIKVLRYLCGAFIITPLSFYLLYYKACSYNYMQVLCQVLKEVVKNAGNVLSIWKTMGF